MKGLWQLRVYARPYMWVVPPLLLMLGITSGAGALAIYETKNLFKSILSNVTMLSADERMAHIHQAASAALVVLALLLLAGIGEAVAVYASEWLGNKLLVDLRKSLFTHMETLSVRFFEGSRSGEMVSRINADTLVLQNVLGMQLAPAILAPLATVAYVSMMIKISWRLTMLLLILGPSVALLTAYLGRRLRRYAIITQEQLANLSVVIDENFSLMRVVKIFGLEKLVGDRFGNTAEAVMHAEMRTAKMRAMVIPVVGGFMGIVICLALLMATYEVLNGRMQPETPLTFILLLQQAGSQINKLSRLSLQLQRAEAAAQRTVELLSVIPELEDAPDAVELTHVNGKVTFDNVGLDYIEGVPVLSNINLTIQPGEVVAIVGPSGSGKTTLANLIPRLYDPTRGRVLIDDVDVRDYTQGSLRSHMGIVPQETVLFSGSIRENIGLGLQGSTNEQIYAAASAADADVFIRDLSEGYDTPVGERGAKVSGGQRQRVAIARAILRDPRILILDEATSSLDRASEAAVHRAIDTLLQGRTAVIIAHRLSTIRNADRIVVLSSGRIVEQGTHAELLDAGGLYSALYASQEVTEDRSGNGSGHEPPQLAL